MWNRRQEVGSCETVVTSTEEERLCSCVQIKISGITFETSIMQDDEKRSQASGAFTSFVDTLLACAPGLKTLTLEHTRRWGDGEKANPTVGLSTTKSELLGRVCDSRCAAFAGGHAQCQRSRAGDSDVRAAISFHSVSCLAFPPPAYTA